MPKRKNRVAKLFKSAGKSFKKGRIGVGLRKSLKAIGRTKLGRNVRRSARQVGREAMGVASQIATRGIESAGNRLISGMTSYGGV